ncbi:MAG TPA: integration host factor, actinobacterial type [Solirubrobacteraceae bacterium]|nr:integration host factor, actinobacterial type [Solirubrobacteraceae bacterium]
MPAPSSTAVQQPAALDRSLTQRQDALEQANTVRTQRAKLKSDLRAGRCLISTVLLDPPQYVQSAKVLDVLLAVPTYGHVKANKMLTRCRISPSKTIGGLTQRQRTELAQLLDERS